MGDDFVADTYRYKSTWTQFVHWVMDEVKEGVTIHWVSVWVASSLSIWVLVNPPLIPQFPAGYIGSFWTASCIIAKELSPAVC